MFGGKHGRKRIGAPVGRISNGDQGFPNESALVKAILNYFAWRGILAWRMPVQGVMQKRGDDMCFKKSPIRGFPDIAGVYRKHFFAIECKTEKGRLSEAQHDWFKKLHAMSGITVRLIRPQNWKEDCDAILREIDDWHEKKVA